MFILISVFPLLLCVEGFLLDKPQNVGGQTVLSGQYVTVSSYFEEKKLQQQEMLRQRQDTDKLRHDIDQNLALLASQLQQKFDILEQNRVDEVKLNKTKEDLLLYTEQKYQTLEQNHNYLKQEHSKLLKKYSVLENEIIAMTNKTKQAEEIDAHQESFNNGIDMRIRMQGEELNTIRNKSLEVEREMLSLKQLANIKPLNAITAIQKTVNTLTSQTNALRVNEQARSQDFLALFNMTVDTKKSLVELSNNVNSQIQQLGHNQTVSLVAIEHTMTNELYDFRINQNKTFMDIKNMVRAAENRTNGTLASLQGQIKHRTEKVALMSYLPIINTATSGILKFSDVKFSVGINNLETYKATGKFECEISGIYLVSVSIIGTTRGANLFINLNGNIISNTRISEGDWQTGTAVLAVQLLNNDKLWIEIETMTISGNKYAVFSILKIL